MPWQQAAAATLAAPSLAHFRAPLTAQAAQVPPAAGLAAGSPSGTGRWPHPRPLISNS